MVPSDAKEAAKKKGKPGITTDPRKGQESYDAQDKALTKRMAVAAAEAMKSAGLNPAERMSGNKLGTKGETFTYPTKEMSVQEGTTGGMYFSTKTQSAPAANVVLIETYNNYTSQDGKDVKRAAELESFVKAILDVFVRK